MINYFQQYKINMQMVYLKLIEEFLMGYSIAQEVLLV